MSQSKVLLDTELEVKSFDRLDIKDQPLKSPSEIKDFKEMKLGFSSALECLELCERYDLDFSSLMIYREAQLFETPVEETRARILHRWQLMKASAVEALNNPKESMGGLLGGEAKTLMNYFLSGESLLGETALKAASYALSVLEVNASMGLIVAAPTAGASGVLPGAFLAVQEKIACTDEKMLDALFTASAVGLIITASASVSGAEAGCQAEVGSATAMAAAGIVTLKGGTMSKAFEAASTAIANLLGLVCDPVAGLVELPCQRRNAIGALNALLSAELSLAGISSPIPFDEMVNALYEVGTALPASLRETALGGMAATKTACGLCKGVCS